MAHTTEFVKKEICNSRKDHEMTQISGLLEKKSSQKELLTK